MAWDNQGSNRRAYKKNIEEIATVLPEGIVPPQAVELEEVVLGALLLEGETITTVQEYLTEEAFYKAEHKVIYHAIDELSAQQKEVDLYSVTEKLRADQLLQQAGGAQYLMGLTQKVGSAANVDQHSRIIAQKYVQRELIRSAIDIQKQAYDSSKDVDELIGYAESEILKVTDGHIKKAVQQSSDILRRTIEIIEMAGQNDSDYSGVRTGFKDLDDLTLGWQPSDLIIIAARPSMGKTAFVLSMARNICVDYNLPVALFSLEMASTQLMTRLIVAETEIPSTTIRSGKLTAEQWKHLEVATKPLGRAPLFIDDTPALSIFEFRSKARRMHIHNGIKLIIIDYLQLMTCERHGDKGNREQEVSFISRTLKAIAKELNIPIIALSQLSRQTEMRGGSHRPQLSDLRESGAIEQDADIVAFIHRPEYYGINQLEDGTSSSGVAQICVAKHRNGEVKDVKMRFRKEQAKFSDFEMAPLATEASLAEERYDDFASSIGKDSLGGINGADQFQQDSFNPSQEEAY
ncbi:MAG: replicative DNA helicase [Alistipes sp.]|nr:replicative DNA helicase [Candidatus Alistipes equi]